MSGTERLLEVLLDHKPHSSHELYRLGLMVHSRAADIRRQGYTLHCWREDIKTGYGKSEPCWWYKLDPLSEAATPSPPGSPALAASPSGLAEGHEGEVTSSQGNGNEARHASPLTFSEPEPQADVGMGDTPVSLAARPSEAASGSELQLFDTRRTDPWA